MKKMAVVGLAILGAGVVVGLAPAISRAQGGTQQLPPVTLDLRDAPVREALEQLFKNAKVQYVIDPAVGGYISSLNIKDQPFRNALNLIVRTASPPLSYSVENNVYIVRPRRTDAFGGGAGGTLDGAGGYPGGGARGGGGYPGGGGIDEGGGGPSGIGGVGAGDTRLDKITVTYADAADIAAVFGGGVLQIGAGRGNQNGGQGGQGGFGGGGFGGGFGGGQGGMGGGGFGGMGGGGMGGMGGGGFGGMGGGGFGGMGGGGMGGMGGGGFGGMGGGGFGGGGFGGGRTF